MKTRERAKGSVWWLRLSTQIQELVSRCPTCLKELSNPAEPLMPLEVSEYPWQKLVLTCFIGKQSKYLLVDYYSRFIEISFLNLTTSDRVIHHFKSIFARHGIPKTVMTDKTPQFASQAFSEYANNITLLIRPLVQSTCRATGKQKECSRPSSHY